MRLLLAFLLIPHATALKATSEDILQDHCHECESPHYNGPRPDQYTTLSCVRQLGLDAPRDRVQYYAREHPICIALVVFDGLKPLFTIRTGVPAKSLPRECFDYRLKGGYYFPKQTITIDSKFGYDTSWQSEESLWSNYDAELDAKDPFNRDDEIEKNATYTGALMCCGSPMCNSEDVEHFLPMRIVEKEEKTKSWMGSLHVVIIVSILAITLWPFFMGKAYTNERVARLNIEKPDVLDQEWIDYEQPQTIIFVNAKEANTKEAHALFAIDQYDYCRDLNKVVNNIQSRHARHINEDEHFTLNFTAEITTISTYIICNTVYEKVSRKSPTKLHNLAAKMIEHGPYEFEIDPLELAKLFDSATRALERRSSYLLSLPFTNIVIVGRLDGDYVQLFRIFQKFGWPPSQSYLFLGGLTHRDKRSSLETLCLLLALKVRYPDHIHLLRGVAETEGLHLQNRFPGRLAQVISLVSNEVFSRFALAAVISDRIFCVHGGLSPHISTKAINDVKHSSAEVTPETNEARLIFSMSHPEETYQIPGARGWLFNPEVVENFAKKHPMITAIVRSRSDVPSGIHVDGFALPVITLHSSTLSSKEGVEQSAAVLKVCSERINVVRFAKGSAQFPNARKNTKDEVDPAEAPPPRLRKVKEANQ